MITSVAKSETFLLIPALSRIAGVTTKMYESARNVDSPASISRGTVEPFATMGPWPPRL